jgi:hypothetical protein
VCLIFSLYKFLNLIILDKIENDISSGSFDLPIDEPMGHSN